MTAMLIVISITVALYFHTSIINNIKDDMILQSKYIEIHYKTQEEYNQQRDLDFLKKTSPYQTTISLNSNKENKPLTFIASNDNHKSYLLLVKSYDNNTKSLIIERDISEEKSLINSMYGILAILILIGIIFIIFYAYTMSNRLMSPLQSLTKQFTTMHDNILHEIETKDLPYEFTKLAESVNLLIKKISTSIKYRQELYIGTAHELKTPLAVMRLKNQITLMKYKKQDKVREALEQNITSIDTLTAMIHNLLEFGRAEGAQFEQPQRLNLIRLMASKCEEYELLANSQNRNFIYHFEIPHFRIQVQPLLFMQIFQNFIQNALKFTPAHSLVSLTTRMDNENFIIEITDEGDGIDESKDLFAPFQRSLESTGAGLGLFLAQNAAESMGVTINIKNREDKKGAIASIAFPLNRFLLKD